MGVLLGLIFVWFFVGSIVYFGLPSNSLIPKRSKRILITIIEGPAWFLYGYECLCAAAANGKTGTRLFSIFWEWLSQ